MSVTANSSIGIQITVKDLINNTNNKNWFSVYTFIENNDTIIIDSNLNVHDSFKNLIYKHRININDNINKDKLFDFFDDVKKFDHLFNSVICMKFKKINQTIMNSYSKFSSTSIGFDQCNIDVALNQIITYINGISINKRFFTIVWITDSSKSL